MVDVEPTTTTQEAEHVGLLIDAYLDAVDDLTTAILDPESCSDVQTLLRYIRFIVCAEAVIPTVMGKESIQC